MYKRAFDLVVGFFALILALPLMILVAMMIYLEDGSPVIFRQKRVGKGGRLFEIFKFRTMVRNAEHLQNQLQRRDIHGNLLQKSKNDPRITRVGRVLRRFSLDELPQLFNVFNGTMSLVGPRPEIPYLAEKYEPWQLKRFTVLPGMTGWWQVNSRNAQPMQLHIEYDLYYIQNYSVCLDLQIIFRTIWVVLIGRGSY